MNQTLLGFSYPDSIVKEFDHWVVLIRPVQTTPLSCIIAARAGVESIGELGPLAGAELPLVIRGFERAVKLVAQAVKFNYLALMMVDPNPHFHAIPRYETPVTIGGHSFTDTAFPKPVNVLTGLKANATVLKEWQSLLAASWEDPL